MIWREEPLDWIAWAAGLFEGEGSIHFPTGARVAVRMELTMTDEDVVRRFHKAVKCGKFYGPYNNRGTAFQPVFRWGLSRILVSVGVKHFAGCLLVGVDEFGKLDKPSQG
jgi:hypothetical protein